MSSFQSALCAGSRTWLQTLDEVDTFGNRRRGRAATYSLRVPAGRTICSLFAKAWRAALQLLVCGRPQAKPNSLQTLRLSSARAARRTRGSAAAPQALLDKILCIHSEYTNHLSSSSPSFVMTGQG